MATGYQYKQLDNEKEQIRLLSFECGSNEDPSQPLSCRVEVVSLQAPLPEFYAVSYTWGDTTERTSIKVDGQDVSIPQNAGLALRSLHNHESDEDIPIHTPHIDVKLWLDAICINQSDPEEKSEQLLLIGGIYDRAEEVLIWLGEDDDGSAKEAVKAIDYVVDQCKRETNNLADLTETVWTVSKTDLSSRHTSAPLSFAIDLVALRKFYSSPWFQRLWIIQETVYATHAVCYRGSTTVSFDEVALAARWLWYRTYGRLFPGDNQYMAHIIAIQNCSTIWDIISTPHIIQRKLSHLLLLGMRFDTTDPRDKVYSILGLLDPSIVTTLYIELIPDYTVSLEALYTRATRNVIVDTQSLFIIKMASRLVPPETERDGEEELDFPSWVPRFDWSHDVNRGSASAIRSMYRPASNTTKLRLRAPGGLSSILTVQGIIVDEVGHMAALSWESISNSVETLKPEIASTWTMTKEHASIDLCRSLETAYALTVCTGRNQSSTDLTRDPRFQQNCAAFFGLCDASCTLLAKYFGSSERAQEATLAGNAREYLMAIAQNTKNLRFFVTADGRLGMGPKGMLQDDRICIVPGCDVPIVLRKEGPFWRLLGDAYVYGIMDGEYYHAMEFQGRLESEMQWFHIH